MAHPAHSTDDPSTDPAVTAADVSVRALHRRPKTVASVSMCFGALTLAVALLGQPLAANAPALEATDVIDDVTDVLEIAVDTTEADEVSDISSSVITTDITTISQLIRNYIEEDDLGLISMPLTFDDSWFAADADPTVYNHELAYTCAVLASAINAESYFYDGRADIDFIGDALRTLGFVDIDTTSYAGRSGVIDEIRTFFSGDIDSTAYVFAHKELADGQTLVFVGIRGTYGVEWLSNFNMLNSLSDDEDTVQHLGFATAETEVAHKLSVYCTIYGIDMAKSSVLIVGHSRGAAIANLLAAELDDMAVEAQTDSTIDTFALDNIYAYTIAPPNTTQAADAGASRYDNIFNLVSPLDLVPRLPMPEWGWTCYGVTLSLPDSTDEDFAELYAAMEEQRALNTGYWSSGQPFLDDGTNILTIIEDQLTTDVPDFESLLSISGLQSLGTALGSLDSELTGADHFLDTYMAWLQTIDPDRLTRQ